ncbi:MAG: flagellar hook capping FlgD N-terminal domain-containing protein [bacterium]
MTSAIDITNSLTTLQNNTAAVQAQKNAKTAGSSDMGQDAFLQLLMAQLKNQDPLNPTDSNQFMSQQAQFTQISELQKLNKSVTSSNQMMQASTLIGKDVSLTDPNDTKKTISGTVSEAKINSSGASVVVNGNEYPLNNILSVKEASTSSTSSGASSG